MHRVVPELIIENYRAGRFRGEFPAMGMFLDLTGFSNMTDTLMLHGQHGAEVLAYRRTLLVYRRGATAPYANAGY